MTTEVIVYCLTEAECQVVYDINAPKARGPQIIICDHGHGSCVEKSTIDDVLYAEWRNAIESISPDNPFSTRETKVCIISDF